VSGDHDFVQILFASGDTRPSVVLVRDVDALPSTALVALLLAALPGQLTELLRAGAIARASQSPATAAAAKDRRVTAGRLIRLWAEPSEREPVKSAVDVTELPLDLDLGRADEIASKPTASPQARAFSQVRGVRGAQQLLQKSRCGQRSHRVDGGPEAALVATELAMRLGPEPIQGHIAVHAADLLRLGNLLAV
jgi:hypothetical protein